MEFVGITIFGGVNITPPAPAAPPPPYTSTGPAKLWSWGQNYAGGLGHSNTTNKSSPIQVGALTDWSQIAASYYHALAIKNDGTLWAWGYNDWGNLGQGDTVNRSSPTQIGAINYWSSVSQSGGQVLARQTDGTLWAWGDNTNGALGLGDTVKRSSPVQVGTLKNWARVIQSRSSVGIKTDGTIWSWGGNSYGQLGLGNTTNYSSPKQIGALTTWASISSGGNFVAAIKTDGALWTWGQNFEGTLGQGNTTNRSSPVQVGSLTNWSKISISFVGHMHAIKTDGTLWGWGKNLYGQIGVGTSGVKVESPVQVGALTTWSNVACGDEHTMATLTDNKLYIWGKGDSGQHGTGTTINRSSPQQVGAAVWVDISASNESSYALSTV